MIVIDEKKIFEIAEQVSRNKKDITNIKDIIKDVVNRVHEMQEKKGFKGTETGFAELDKLTSGLQNGDLIVIAGRPSMGKTSLSMNIVEHVAIHNSIPVAVFSLEMPTEQLLIRMISSFGRIDSSKLRDGDMVKVCAATGELSTQADLSTRETAPAPEPESGMGREFFALFRAGADGAEQGASAMLAASGL